jgi:hypothetical protein
MVTPTRPIIRAGSTRKGAQALGRLEALLERLHEARDLRGPGRLGDADLLALELLRDHLQQHVAVGVPVLVGAPVGGQRVDELAGQVHLLLDPSLAHGREVEIGGRPDLVGEAHGGDHEGAAGRLDGGQLLALAEDDRADAHAPRLLERVPEPRTISSHGTSTSSSAQNRR